MQGPRPVTKPSKQRKMLFQAHAHLRYKHFSAHLSPEMRASHKARSLPVRTGDTVRIMRGDNKGVEGKITRVDRGKYRVYVEGLTREKVDGTAIPVPVHPSKVMITNLNLDDKWRKKIIQRRKEAQVKLAAQIAEEPKKKAEKAKPEIVEGKIPTEEKPKPRKPRETKKRAVRKPARKKTETETPEVEEKPVKKRATRRKTKKSEAEGES